jgi:hypothetical protein
MSIDMSRNGEDQFIPVNDQVWSRQDDESISRKTQTDWISVMTMPERRIVAVLLPSLVFVRLDHASNQVVAVAIARSLARSNRDCGRGSGTW